MTVAYAAPALNPLRDPSDNPAADLPETEAANGLPARAPGAPGGFEATGTAAGTVALAWSAPWHNGSPIQRYEYRWKAMPDGGAEPAFGDDAADPWTRVAATARSATASGLADAGRYAFQLRAVNGAAATPANPAGGKGAIAQTAMAVTAADTTPPRLTGAGIGQARGAQLILLRFDEALAGPVPALAAFAVTVTRPGSGSGSGSGPGGGGSTSRTHAPVMVLPTGDSTGLEIHLAPEHAVQPGEAVSVAYTPPAGPGASPLRDTVTPDANAAPAFDTAGPDVPDVANTLPHTVPDRPEGLLARGKTADSMLLTWRTPWNNGRPILRYELRWKAGAGALFAAADAWTAIAGSGPGTTRHIVTGLRDGAAYTFQLRAANAEGRRQPRRDRSGAGRPHRTGPGRGGDRRQRPAHRAHLRRGLRPRLGARRTPPLP